MKITALLENKAADSRMRTEHGLSLYIETAAHTILFDMGQTTMFAENASVLGLNPADADLAVLSHGHYDHGGGLACFLEINQTAPVYISTHAFEPHYNGTEKYIGLDPSLAGNPRLIWSRDGMTIGEGLTLYTGERIPRLHDKGSFGLTVRRDGILQQDDFRHEQYLMIEEAGRRVLVSGCSHRGVTDLIAYFRPDVFVGGFHYSKIEPGAELDEAAELLGQHDTVYYTCHCTGEAQFCSMKARMKNLHYLACGSTVIP